MRGRDTSEICTAVTAAIRTENKNTSHLARFMKTPTIRPLLPLHAYHDERFHELAVFFSPLSYFIFSLGGGASFSTG